MDIGYDLDGAFSTNPFPNLAKLFTLTSSVDFFLEITARNVPIRLR